MSQLKMIGQASALFKALGELEGEEDKGKTIEQRARFYKLHHGIHFPDEWDELPDKEKERRLDDMDKIALEKDI